MHRLTTIFILAALLIFLPGMAEAQKRIALVIGNGAYTGVSSLANPPNDARLIASTLRDLGFEVIEKINVTQKSMKRAVRDFGELLDAAGDDAIGLFYFAGHGVQVKGINYIIPVDAQISREGDVDIESIDANAVLSLMEHSGASLSFVILDACRNNPFLSSSRSGGRGLAEMNAPTGLFIAYATSPGDVAADGDGSNSPYTKALANAMLETNIAVELMFRKVRNDVRLATNNNQTPWESSSLVGENFYFNQGESKSTSEQNSLSMDMIVWQSIQNSSDVSEFELFVQQYSSSPLVVFAESKMIKLKQREAILIAEAEERVRKEDEARRIAEAEERVRKEEEAQRIAEAEERVRKEDEARRIAEAEERVRKEEEAQRIAEAEERERKEDEARRIAEAEERVRKEEEAQRIAEAEERERKEHVATSQATTSDIKIASIRPIRFSAGKYKPKILATSGFCSGAKLQGMTATIDEITGKWRHGYYGLGKVLGADPDNYVR